MSEDRKMSPLSEALFNCFKSPDPLKQIAALDKLIEEKESEDAKD